MGAVILGFKFDGVGGGLCDYRVSPSPIGTNLVFRTYWELVGVEPGRFGE